MALGGLVMTGKVAKYRLLAIGYLPLAIGYWLLISASCDAKSSSLS
jgi:hypothetical protein